MANFKLTKVKKFVIDNDGIGRILLPKFMVEHIKWDDGEEIEIAYLLDKDEFVIRKTIPQKK